MEEDEVEEDARQIDGSHCMYDELQHELAFEQGLSRYKQRKYALEERRLSEHTNAIPLKYRILEAAVPLPLKALLLQQYRKLSLLGEAPAEFAKRQGWLEAVLQLPWGRLHRPTPLRTPTAQVRHLCTVQQTMDRWIHGHAEAKESILHMVSQSLVHPEGIPQIIGIQGPMGNGKTTLVRQGIAQALERPFVQISLGGIRDASMLRGHGYTYENAKWGAVAQALMEAGVSNPVLYFDELDKVSECKQGGEIISTLIHMTDSSQNAEFRDAFLEVPLDLSKVVFIFSFNDEKRLSPILLDRLHLIRTQALSVQQKVVIASQYLLPTLARNVGFADQQVELSEDGARYLVDTVSRSEEGVRELRKALESVLLRLNTLFLLGHAKRHKTRHSSIRQVLGGIQCEHAEHLVETLHFPLILTPQLLRKVLKPLPVPAHAHMYT